MAAAVKPFARRGLLTVEPDPDDRRARRLQITPEGVALMREAVEVWRTEHAALEENMGEKLPETLRQGLAGIK